MEPLSSGRGAVDRVRRHVHRRDDVAARALRACTPPPPAPLARIRHRLRREGWIWRPLPLLHGSRHLSAPLLCGSAIRGDVRVNPATSVVSPPSARADPPPVMMGGTEVGWQTGRWGDDLDDGDTCGLGAIAIFSPGCSAGRRGGFQAVDEGAPRRAQPSGGGGSKVGLVALDVALTFPQATMADGDPDGASCLEDEAAHKHYQQQKQDMFVSYLAM
uniref:Uncharacterized protein n=1 Tax=Oryza glumipatula TaxID=40148 RepID=A0A0E0AIG5_9ORYZ